MKEKMSPIKIADMNLLFLLLWGSIFSLSNAQKKCVTFTHGGLKAQDCTNLEPKIKEIPPGLIRQDTEVLFLGNNNLKELKNDSFSCCPNLRMLYLDNNKIQRIEAKAFDSLTNLDVLDLSSNSLVRIPEHLPSSLVRLYMNDNLMANCSASHLKSLQFLSLAECALSEFPALGVMPNLLELNLTTNPLTVVKPKHLANLCRLKILHVSPKSLFGNPSYYCDCLNFQAWVLERQLVTVGSYRCNHDKTSPPACNITASVTDATQQVYENCMAEWHHRHVPIWLMAGGGIVATIVCISIIVYVRLKRRQGRKDRTRIPGEEGDAAVKFNSGNATDDEK